MCVFVYGEIGDPSAKVELGARLGGGLKIKTISIQMAVWPSCCSEGKGAAGLASRVRRDTSIGVNCRRAPLLSMGGRGSDSSA
jgi:hypothetical protein